MEDTVVEVEAEVVRSATSIPLHLSATVHVS